MTETKRTPRIAWVPLFTGLSLWVAATALLLEDAYLANSWHVQHLVVPILTASTCVAGVLAHKKLAAFKVLSGAALLLLALLGSALCVFNVIGRTAADKDVKVATAMAGNRVLGERHEELTRARQEMAKECRVRGTRCKDWEQRVDQLQRETSSMLARSLDPRADAVARLAKLVGLDGDNAKEIVAAIDPAAMPIFLELGAIILLGCAFPHRRRDHQQFGKNYEGTLTVAANNELTIDATVVQPWARETALADFKRLKHAGGQHLLATRWGVDRATVSRWLASWERDGLISRNRIGKEKAALALPAPSRGGR